MPRIWILFWTLGIIWGSSFMLIRIGVEAIHPVQLVVIRTGIAAAGLCLVVIFKRKAIPRNWRTLGSIALIGVGNVAVPFTLISFGEQTVESGLASVLQATAALFGLVVAHFAFVDERITRQRVTGLLLGFAGVIVLSARNWQEGVNLSGGFAGQMMIVAASLSYATFTTLSRKIIQGQVEPVVLSALAMLSGALTESALLFFGVSFLDFPATVPATLDHGVLGAVLLLGFLNTFIAYLIFYEIVRVLGAGRATMVTYVVPAVGLLLGVLLLGERLDLFIIVGAGLIFTGIAIVNLRAFAWLNRVRLAPSGD